MEICRDGIGAPFPAEETRTVSASIISVCWKYQAVAAPKAPNLRKKHLPENSFSPWN